jgi:CBS domain-containing protein
MSLLARDLMEPNVLTIPAKMKFREVQHLLVETGCYGAPVVDDRGIVMGVVSAMDLLRAADQAYDDDIDPGEGPEPDVGVLTALELATPEPVWVAPEASPEQIALVMREHNIHRVLVGNDGKLVGVVSTFDLLRAVR